MTSADPPTRPNVVMIVLDDLGFAQLGSFGSSIATPHVDALAASGLRYNRFHVTAICSPTRASLLTGRNHHAVGLGFLVDIPVSHPGYTGRIPQGTPTLPGVLRDSGYNTLAVGKWHLTPRGDRTSAGPFTHWPLGLGFERYYGFLHGCDNQWTPHLVRDNRFVEPPARPEDGYHLTEDLIDNAITDILDQQHAAPGKPFFLYLPLGAMHAPHHVTAEWVQPYRGAFDAGWERERAATFDRQRILGVVPEGATLTESPPWVPDWDALPADRRRMLARQQEVFAGFLTHTDAQIGRLVAFLERIGQLDNTLIMIMSDNGASAEGGQDGTFNDNWLGSRDTVDLSEQFATLEDWGGFRGFPNYSWGWAWAGNTPFRLWKRYNWLGGVRSPLIVSWANGIGARGEVRDQITHATDIMPTILSACAVDAPASLDGRSFADSFDDPSVQGRHTQYFEVLGSRSIIRDGWKAVTDHVSTGIPDEEDLLVGSRSFEDDRWSLFALDTDFSEAHDLADEYPGIVDKLAAVWQEEAERNHVMPMVDALRDRLSDIIARPYPPRGVYLPGAGPIPEEVLPSLGGGFQLTVIADEPGEGMLCALGDWNGGFAFYVDDGFLTFSLCRAGQLDRVVASEQASGDAFTAVVRPDSITLRHGDRQVAHRSTHTSLAGLNQHHGIGLVIGYDRGFPVDDCYQPPLRWTGTIREVRLRAHDIQSPTLREQAQSALRGD